MALTPQQMAALQTMLSRQQQEAKPDLEFRAGICHVKGRSVTADSRRGKVEIYKEDSGEIRLQWVLRPSNQSEINLVLLPQQAVFHRINDCKDGRIFALQFVDSSTRHIFWLQEPKESEEKDNQLLKKLNETIQAGVYNPPRSTPSNAASSTASAAAAAAAPSAASIDPSLLAELGMADADEQAELLAMIQAATQANNNNNSSSNTTPSTPAPKSSTPAPPAAASSTAPAANSLTSNPTSALLSALQSIAQQFQASQSSETEKQPTLSDIFDADQIYSMVSDDENLLKELCALLPEGQRTKEDLKSQLRSPQLRSTLSRMTALLNSPQYGQLLASLSLPTNTQNMGVLGLIEAIHKAVNQKKGDSSSSANTNEKK